MTILINNSDLFEINDGLIDIYNIQSGTLISSNNALHDIFNIPIDSFDAVLNWGDGHFYFFKDDQYYRFNVSNNKVDDGYPQSIEQNWKGNYASTIWACVRSGNKAYFFQDASYIRYDCNADKTDDGYPLNIEDQWHGLKSGITGIAMLNDSTAIVQYNNDYFLYDFIANKAFDSNATSLQTALTSFVSNSSGATPIQPSTAVSSFEQRGNEFIEKLKSAASVQLGGDSAGGKQIADFEAWFGILQDILTKSTQWGSVEEDAQHLLKEYIESYYNEKGIILPPNVKVFLNFIGRGEANKNANQKINGANHAGMLGAVTAQDEAAGAGKRYQWCQAASSNAVNIALKESGYELQTGKLYTDSWYKKDLANRLITGKTSFDAVLEAGDMISIVSNKTALSGHVMTVIEDKTDSIIAVSGNAGGKAIRIEEVKRGIPPDSYNWGNYYDDKKPKQPGINQPINNSVVWVVSIQKTSLLNHLDVMDNSELQQYGLVKK